jgi:hypothetical protein
VNPASFKQGQQPSFGMILTNASGTACTKDVGQNLRQIVIADDKGTRLWGNTDCTFTKPPADVQTLAPGKQLTYSVTWQGRTSAQGCPSNRKAVGPGTYTITAHIGSTVSKSVAFSVK